MDMTNKEFAVSASEIKFEESTINLNSKIDTELTLQREYMNKRMIEMLEIDDMLKSHKLFMRYFDSISLTAFIILIVTCITAAVFIVSDYYGNYTFLKICSPFITGCYIGCFFHICQMSKKLSIELFRLSEFLKRRSSK